MNRRTSRLAVLSSVVLGLGGLSAAPALAAHGNDLFAVNINNTLFETARDNPDSVIRSAQITGLQNGENVVGIDFRPVDGEIYGITDAGRIYRIEYRPSGGVGAFGAATFISSLVTDTGDKVALDGVNFGVNFNPVADRLRVVSDRGQNLRINVDSGVTIVDGPLKYAAGDANAGKTPHVTAAAYTNPDNDPSTGTELFDIDAGQKGLNDIVSKQSPPNDGTLVTRGMTDRNSTTLVGYDIDTDNFGVASLIGGDGTELVRLQLDNDPATDDMPTVTSLGFFPESVGQLRDIALAIPDPDGVPDSGPMPVVPEFPLAALAPLLGLGVVGVVVARRRRTV